MNAITFAGDPMDPIIPLGNGGPSGIHFAWDSSIDPSLGNMANISTSATSGQAVVTVPQPLAETVSRILIYLAEVIEIPESEYRHKLGEEGVDMEPRTRTLRSGRTFAG
jgi:hypothetical protein